MDDHTRYYDRGLVEYLCGHCSWAGQGTDLSVHRRPRLIDLDCPTCGALVVRFPSPEAEEIEDAAARGLAEAIVDLDRLYDAEPTWDDILQSRRSPIAIYRGTGTDPVHAFLLQARVAGYDRICLYVNEFEVHWEFSRPDDIEPAQRLLQSLLTSYGERLRTFDPYFAADYLIGDSAENATILRNLVSQVPDGDGRGPGPNRYSPYGPS